MADIECVQKPIDWTKCNSGTAVRCDRNIEISKVTNSQAWPIPKLNADNLKYSQRNGGFKSHSLTPLNLEPKHHWIFNGPVRVQRLYAIWNIKQ